MNPLAVDFAVVATVMALQKLEQTPPGTGTTWYRHPSLFRWLLTDGFIKHGEDQNEETGGSDRQRVFGMESPLTAIVKAIGDIDEELRALQTNFNQRSPQPSKSGNDDSSVCDLNYRLSTDLKGGPTELQACISSTAVWEGHARSWLE